MTKLKEALHCTFTRKRYAHMRFDYEHLFSADPRQGLLGKRLKQIDSTIKIACSHMCRMLNLNVYDADGLDSAC